MTSKSKILWPKILWHGVLVFLLASAGSECQSFADGTSEAPKKFTYTFQNGNRVDYDYSSNNKNVTFYNRSGQKQGSEQVLFNNPNGLEYFEVNPSAHTQNHVGTSLALGGQAIGMPTRVIPEPLKGHNARGLFAAQVLPSTQVPEAPIVISSNLADPKSKYNPHIPSVKLITSDGKFINLKIDFKLHYSNTYEGTPFTASLPFQEGIYTGRVLSFEHEYPQNINALRQVTHFIIRNDGRYFRVDTLVPAASDKIGLLKQDLARADRSSAAKIRYTLAHSKQRIDLAELKLTEQGVSLNKNFEPVGTLNYDRNQSERTSRAYRAHANLIIADLSKPIQPGDTISDWQRKIKFRSTLIDCATGKLTAETE